MGRLNHKKGRPTNYRKSLKSNPYWDEVKRRIRLRDNFKCIECGSIIRLETHHITYYVGGISIVGNELEHLNWLVTLCETCHQKVHNNPNHRFNPKNKNKVKIK
ncbi:HNH endonuclease [Flavobacterium sp.]